MDDIELKDLKRQREDSKRWVQRATGFFIFISLLGLGGGLYFLLSGQTNTSNPNYVPLEGVFAGVVLLITAIGALNFSRLCALALLGLILLDFTGLPEGPQAAGTVVRLGAYAFLAAMLTWHAFRHHRLSRRVSERPAGLRFLRWTCLILVILCTPIFALSLYARPMVEIASGDAIDERHVAFLRDHGIIGDDEPVLHFYAVWNFWLGENGYAVTDEAVRMWWSEDEDIVSAWLLHDRICNIAIIEEQSSISRVVIRFGGADANNWINVSAPTRNDGHVRLVEAVEERAVNVGRTGDGEPCGPVEIIDVEPPSAGARSG